MNKAVERYWNEAYANSAYRADHEGWLTPYLPLLHPEHGRIVDLGCGLGYHARMLHDAGFEVSACDLSERALELLQREAPGIETLRLDMTQGLPWMDGELQAIVADLSLHYFPENNTFGVMRDIRRTLRSSGLLLCRLNAIGELADKPDAVPVEGDRHLYEDEGMLRRFFDEEAIEYFFPKMEWETLTRLEGRSNKYGKAKSLWEVALRRR